MNKIEVNVVTGEAVVVPLTAKEVEAAQQAYAAENTPERIKARLENAVQQHLDAQAAKRGYAGILSAASYATSLNPTFGPEGMAYRDWRDAVWTYCYKALAEVQAGARTIPTADELIAELPVLVLP